MIMTKMARALPCGLGLLLLSGGARAQAPQPAVDLKMFSTEEADRSKGCSVALWQADRDPARDKFAVLFHEVLIGQTRAPARIKVGDAVLTLQRVATGGATSGYGLAAYQLYRTTTGDDYVILNLTLGAVEGEAVSVEGGTMTVVMRGRQVFRASVKGGAGCAAAPVTKPVAAAPAAKPVAAAPPSQPGGAFRQYQVRMTTVPPAFLQAVEKKYDCDMDFMKSEIIGFQLSEESAIWQVRCMRAAYQTTAVYALVYLPAPATNLRFLGFQQPPGHRRTGEAGVLIDPEWNVATRTVTSVALGRGAGDCGVLERHRVSADGTFALVEYREKDKCDGRRMAPEAFPKIYPR